MDYFLEIRPIKTIPIPYLLSVWIVVRVILSRSVFRWLQGLSFHPHWFFWVMKDFLSILCTFLYATLDIYTARAYRYGINKGIETSRDSWATRPRRFFGATLAHPYFQFISLCDNVSDALCLILSITLTCILLLATQTRWGHARDWVFFG